MSPLQEAPAIDDNLSDLENVAGSQVGSFKGSAVCSAITGSQSQMGSVRTGANYSAFTAPPRYRNSGAFVHGTKFRHFHSIMEQGLKAAKSDIYMIDEVRSDGRVPGLRDPPEILILIDETKARCAKMDFEYDAAQGSWKTKGINGVVRPWFFQKVVDQRPSTRGNVLFQSKQDPMMFANVLKGSLRPKHLVHATYWENVNSIWQNGILPAKNPISELRRPFTKMLQGAESHVYTVNLSKASDSLNGCDLSVPLSRQISRDVVEEVTPESVPENKDTTCALDKSFVGLERAPDAFFVIDIARADKLGCNLELVQSADRDQTIFIQGPVPPELLSQVAPNDPLMLPDELKAKIVDPRSFDEIPIIDLSSDETTVVKQLQYACEVVGFMQIVGHGISEDLIRQHMHLQREFFALPEAVKDELRLCEENPVRGYFGKGGEDLDQVLAQQVDDSAGEKIKRQARRDNKEALDTNGVPWSKPVGGYIAKIFGLPSRLPAEELVPNFKEILEKYSSEMFKLARKLLRLMAKVLGLAADFFEQHITQPVATHRLLHYWPVRDFDKEIGVGEHTDYGLLTILLQDQVGGLQVLNAQDGHWVHCCPIDGAFVVNLGDMLARWTGHRFKSTVHRVVNVAPIDRYSVPYFLEPNMQTQIVPGELCPLPSNLEVEDSAALQHQRRCQLRKWWQQLRNVGPSATSEEILERFYRASGQLKLVA